MISCVSISINGEFLDIDESTAIGFTIQNFTPTDAANVHLSYSNTFSIPKTPKNCRIFDFANSVHYAGTSVYSKRVANVYLDGALLMNALVNISSITDDRIELYAIDKLDLFESLKSIPFAESSTYQGNTLQGAVATYMQTNHEITGPSKQASFDNFITYSATIARDKYLMPLSVGTMHNKHFVLKNNPNYTKYVADNYDGDNALEDIQTIRCLYDDYDNIITPIKSPHIAIDLREVAYVINDIAGIDSNLADIIDEVFEELDEEFYLLCPDLIPRLRKIVDTPTSEVWGCSVKYDNTSLYSIDDTSHTYMKGKTAYDFIKMIMQEFCLVLDVSYDATTSKFVYTFKRFDTILSAPAKSFELISIESKSFEIDNIKQYQTITYESIGNSEDSSTTGGKTITCNNRNIDKGSNEDSMFTIGRHLFSYISYKIGNNTYNSTCADFSSTDNIDKFVIISPNEGNSVDGVTIYADKDLHKSNVTVIGASQITVGNNGQYDALQSMVLNPICYKAKVKANIKDVLEIKNYQTCTINGIVGLYYISKVESYNPSTDNYLTLTIYRIK